MNRIKNAGIICLLIMIFIILFVIKVPMPCPIKAGIGISCSTCGMTRAMDALLHFEVTTAYSYNILVFPLAIVSLVSIVMLLYGFITNRNYFLDMLYHICRKYYAIILLLALLSMMINYVRSI